ncbi:MAG TPA: hypothetical protein GX707_10960 [Epulopiscium sp.]|nr:hypothetical protein [Candidatus Epulonipiscium sp.]
MLKFDVDGIDLTEVEALVAVTEQFVGLADTLLGKGDISQEEYDSMTLLKKRFLEDVKAKYF